MPGSGHGEHCGEQATGVSLGVPSALRESGQGPALGQAWSLPQESLTSRPDSPGSRRAHQPRPGCGSRQSFQEQLASSSAAGSEAGRGVARQRGPR